MRLRFFFSYWTHAFDYNFRKWYHQSSDNTRSKIKKMKKKKKSGNVHKKKRRQVEFYDSVIDVSNKIKSKSWKKNIDWMARIPFGCSIDFDWTLFVQIESHNSLRKQTDLKHSNVSDMQFTLSSSFPFIYSSLCYAVPSLHLFLFSSPPNNGVCSLFF